MPAPNPTKLVPATKADLTYLTASGDSNGTVLNVKQWDEFISYLRHDAILMKTFQVLRTGVAKAQLDMLGVRGKTMVPATEFTRLATDKRAQITRGKRDISCKTFKSELPLSWKLEKNNIEKKKFRQTLVRELGAGNGIMVDRYGMNSVSNHSDTDYRTLTGILAQCTHEVENNGGAAQTINDTPFYNMYNFLATVDTDCSYIKPNPADMLYLMSLSDESAYHNFLTNSTSATGYYKRETDGRNQMYFRGIPIMGSFAVPDGTMLLTAKDNVIFAIEEDIWFVWYEQPQELASYLIAAMDWDVVVKFVDGIVKCTDLSSPTVPTT